MNYSNDRSVVLYGDRTRDFIIERGEAELRAKMVRHLLDKYRRARDIQLSKNLLSFVLRIFRARVHLNQAFEVVRLRGASQL
ncbi:hypothetical protein KIP88_43890 [Bradyrhizobium sp. SRL28]|uniref:hypothetical protein n=1 Tax=Bradyrhizobium sp. SRL28 TaxID=2836178 RepID=UPI001BDF2CC5|nr:hypothetical protein [Bradyrhizobium sp. SRL28]MBT1517274.1 hypothetical protein [Bradyrhizobium sp. SRL28]